MSVQATRPMRQTGFWCRVAGFIAVGALCDIAHAQINSATPDAERLRRLEEGLAQVQQENRELRQEVQALKASLAKPPGAPVAGTATAPGAPAPIVVVMSDGGESKLRLGGFVHLNAERGNVGAFEGRLPGGPAAVNDRFRIRRARLNVTGEFAEHFDFKLEGDFQFADGIASGRTGYAATDVFLNWNRWPAAKVKVGQFKAPFGLEQTTSDTIILTAERSLATGALTPERQIGAQLSGQPLARLLPERRDLLGYALGVFNGNGRNTTVNDNDNVMVVARLESTPFVGKLFGQSARLKLGVEGLASRDAANVNLSPGLGLALQADGSLASFATHTPAQRRAWAANASATVGAFDFVAEFLEERIRPTTAPANFRPFTANGYYVQGGYFVWSNRLQFVGKWESFNPGQARDDDIRSSTTGFNYFVKGHGLKLMFDYIRTRSDFRHANPRFGRAEFDQLLGRMQVVF